MLGSVGCPKMLIIFIQDRIILHIKEYMNVKTRHTDIVYALN